MNLLPTSALGRPGESAGVVATGMGYRLEERADLGCVQIVAGGEDRQGLDALSLFVGAAVPATGAVLEDAAGNALIALSPRNWLLVCDRSAEEGLVEKFARAFPLHDVHATQFGDYLPWLELSGDRSEAVLGKMGFLRLDGRGMEIGSARRLLLAHIPVVLHRRATASWRIGVERSRVVYFCDWIHAVETNVGGWPAV